MRVWGWKVWLVWEAPCKVPLALRLDGLNVGDNAHAYAVLKQAHQNVAGYATLRSVALDREAMGESTETVLARYGVLAPGRVADTS